MPSTIVEKAKSGNQEACKVCEAARQSGTAARSFQNVSIVSLPRAQTGRMEEVVL